MRYFLAIRKILQRGAMDSLDNHPIISDQISKIELQKILFFLHEVLHRQTPGDVVELGCYVGTTSLFLQRLLAQEGKGRVLHVYDSFEGLPPKTTPDSSPAGEQFTAGELRTSKQVFIRHFKQAGLPLPVIHKGWFHELAANDMPKQIAFAFLDGDFYESIQGSLRLVWPRLSEGAIVIVDDYQSEALPGARLAVDDWLKTHPARLQAVASLAVIKL